jgi:predicted transposase YbfD/YdcC
MIPELLGSLDLEGAIVTLDAMGCQKAIADKILERKANYVLALKDNHPKLRERVERLFVMSRKSGGDRPGSLAGGTISRA